VGDAVVVVMGSEVGERFDTRRTIAHPEAASG
jgi:hypothetical protein